MKKTLLLLILLFGVIYAKDILPIKRFKSVGYVNDFVVNKDRLYVANDMGTVDIFDISSAKIVEQISLPPLDSSMNKIIPADVLSVDFLNDKILILSVGKDGYRDVWVYQNHKLKKIIDESKKLTIKEARFVNDEQIILATLGSDTILHDMSESYNIYDKHISQSALGDIALSSDKKKMIIADESGEVKVLDAKSGDIIESYSSENLDNIFRVAYAKDVIITAGQDKRVGVYRKGKEPYHIKSDFLVFCVGISPDAKVGVYSSTQESHLQLFDIETKKKLSRLIGHRYVVNQIKFISEKKLFSSSRDSDVLYWEID